MKYDQGNTLIEALATLSILVLAVTIAVPNGIALLARERAIADANLLHGALQRTRLHAVTTGVPTIIQAIDGDWSNGWRVFVDMTKNSEPRQHIIAEQSPRASQIKITQTLHDKVHFLPNGQAILPSGGFQAGTFSVCEKGLARSHNLVINRVGRVRRETVAHNAKCSNPGL